MIIIKRKWKDIEGYEGYYQISNTGQVRSLDRLCSNGRIWKGMKRKISKNTTGYSVIRLNKDGVAKQHFVHKLVAKAFILNPQLKPEVDHIDCNKSNNTIMNLKWVTREENMNNPKTIQSNKLSKIGIKNHISKPVICDNRFFETIKNCANHYNVSGASMREWLNDTRKMREDFVVLGLRLASNQEILNYKTYDDIINVRSILMGDVPNDVYRD